MEIYLTQQAMAFVWALLIGCAFGLLFDIFRIVRIAIPVPDVVIAAQDILYFSICAIITFLYLLSHADGRVRFFLIAGIILGAVIYFCTISILVMGVSRLIIAVVRGVLSFALRYLLLPIWRICFGFVSLTLFPARFLIKILKKCAIKIKFILKKWRILLYNQIIRAKKARNSKKVMRRKGV